MEPLGDKKQNKTEKLLLFPECISLEILNFHFENIISKSAEIKGLCLYKTEGPLGALSTIIWNLQKPYS